MVREWVEKAEGDFATALRESRARKNANHDAVCFHAQQYIEKYLKGVLPCDGVAFTWTHDLLVLVPERTRQRPLWLASADETRLF